MAEVVVSDGNCKIPNDPFEKILTKGGEIPGKFQVGSDSYKKEI